MYIYVRSSSLVVQCVNYLPGLAKDKKRLYRVKCKVRVGFSPASLVPWRLIPFSGYYPGVLGMYIAPHNSRSPSEDGELLDCRRVYDPGKE